MKFDIGIPAYNEENNIKTLLTFLTSQKHIKNELNSIIVVSSGSTDRTNEIVQEIAKKRPNVKLITEKERRGQVSAYNLLLQNSFADVIVIMDADIVLFENAIDEILEPISKDTVAVAGHSIPILYNNRFMNNISIIFSPL